MKALILFAEILLGVGLLCPAPTWAQQLTITSPTAVTVVTPGQTITITVSVSSGSVAGVLVSVQDIGTTELQATAPYSFSLTIPRAIVGLKNLTAFGVTGPEQVITSAPVQVDVEPSAQATSLASAIQQIQFGFVGDQFPLNVTATFADGSKLNVTRSTQVMFSSVDATVATVDSTGLVTATGAGTTTVGATYRGQSAIVQVTVPAAVRGDLDGDGRLTADDVRILEAFLGTNSVGPFDARDLNGDGKIDPSDLQILLSLCGLACSNIADTTPPVTAAAGAPNPNANGWNNTNVTVTLNSADNEPGGTGVKQIQWSLTGAQIGSSTVLGGTTTVTISAEGTTVLTYFGTDNAGNIEMAKSITVKIDKTPPVITASANPPVLWPPNGKMVNVTVSGMMADSLSGINPGTALFAVTDAYGLVQPAGLVNLASNGAYSFTISLEARRNGQDMNGRLYTIMVGARDNAGNPNLATTTVIVPHDQGH